MAVLIGGGVAEAGTVPAGFQETTAFDDLTHPTVVRFAPDGTIYVAEKSGLIKTFDGLGDATPTVFADLRTQVHNFWDRGLLGMALDFNYSEFPHVYALYTHDAVIGGTAPRWGTSGATSDGCPTPPGPTGDGCVASGRLSRLVPEGDGSVREDVLIEDWCQQYPSHSLGSIEHDAWGAIYVSAGEGASFNFVDYGQDGDPVNPCGDPPKPVGGAQTPPSAEGGALRAQDVRTPADPTSLDGSVLRVDVNGDPSAINPMFASGDVNARRITASGLRNPFRFDIDEDGEMWIGDVGWGTHEEINRHSYFGFDNFGWPCYEGPLRDPSYDVADLAICETLYSQPSAHTPPYYAYTSSTKVVPGESCPIGSSSISGMRFYRGSTFPESYDGSLFFADYARDCIWVMRAGADGKPSPSEISTFDADASNPVWIESGPDGALYYADFDGGRIQRIQYSAGNQPPSAAIDVDRRSGPPPLSVNFDGSSSSDPDGDPLEYAWDLDGDGELDDSTSETPSHTYDSAGSYHVSLQVSDGNGGTGSATTTIDVGNSPPVPTIAAPIPSQNWSVDESVAFSGSALDPEQGDLPESALDWDLVLEHCPSNCHSHALQSFPERATGSFTAPDHEYPSHLRLRLTATDSGGLTATTSVRLDPKTVELTLASDPPGLDLTLNGSTVPAPFTRELIEGSANSIGAASPQTLNGKEYGWAEWSDGGARAHNVTAESTRTISAKYGLINPDPPPPPPGPEDELTVDVLGERVPARVAGLRRRGARARLSCSADCAVTMKLIAKGRAARRLGITGVVARVTRPLSAGAPTRVRARLADRPARKLSAVPGSTRLRVATRFEARRLER